MPVKQIFRQGCANHHRKSTVGYSSTSFLSQLFSLVFSIYPQQKVLNQINILVQNFFSVFLTSRLYPLQKYRTFPYKLANVSKPVYICSSELAGASFLTLLSFIRIIITKNNTKHANNSKFRLLTYLFSFRIKTPPVSITEGIPKPIMQQQLFCYFQLYLLSSIGLPPLKRTGQAL